MKPPKGISITRVYGGDKENDKKLRQKINEIVFRYRPEQENDVENKLKKSG